MTNSGGIFITFEGIDGSGKSSHARRYADYLRASGHLIQLVREPGDTPVGEKIRQLLLDRSHRPSPLTELLLYEAARSELTSTVILPALTRGEIVLADRYYDSTTAYQGFGRGLDRTRINELNQLASLGLVPTKTVLFDLTVDASITRRGQQPDRLEAESRSFFERVRSGYLTIAAAEPDRFIVVDSSRDAAAVHDDIRNQLGQILPVSAHG